jgi:hypothetical protein
MSLLYRIVFYTLVERSLEGGQARINGWIVDFLNAADHIEVEMDDRRIIPTTAPIAAANLQPKANIRILFLNYFHALLLGETRKSCGTRSWTASGGRGTLL